MKLLCCFKLLVLCCFYLYMVSAVSADRYKSRMHPYWLKYHYDLLNGNPIALKSTRRRYVVAESDGTVNANGNSRSISEIFMFENVGNFKVALKSYQNKYLVAEQNERVSVNGVSREPCAIFTIEFVTAKIAAFKSCYNKYLYAESNGSLKASQDKKSRRTIFRLVRTISALSKIEQQTKYGSLNGTLIALKTFHQRYVVASLHGSVRQINPKVNVASEVFRVETLGNFKIALKSYFNQYVVVNVHGVLKANSLKKSASARFNIQFIDANRVALKSYNNKYVVAIPHGPMHANRARRGDWEIFTLETIAPKVETFASPVNGKVGEWLPWGLCSKTCGVGLRSRKRECNNPPPSNGGAECVDVLSEYQACNTQSCATCLIKGELIGCYKDDMESRAMPELILREDMKSYVANYEVYLQDFLCRCSEVAAKKGYIVIGIQLQYSDEKQECWSGPQSHKTYSTHNVSNTCIDGTLQSVASSKSQETGCSKNTENTGVILSNSVYRISTECSLNYEPLGCFKDEQNVPRPLPLFAFSDRDIIDWNNWKEFTSKLICRCAVAVKSNGHQLFGLQYYGECWSGPAEAKYTRDGNSTECVAEDYSPCSCNSYNCIGKDRANSVYKFRS